MSRGAWAGALLLAACFTLAAAYHLDRPGIQADEALFGQGLWEQGRIELFTRVFGRRVPLMLMPYLGALKSIVYWPIFGWFGFSPVTLRLPMVLAGAATIALTFALLWRLRGGRAAWVGGALLAADPTFLFTTRCDWGPVAIERLLAVGGVYLFMQRRLGWGALLFGLALWNKTTFAWTLIGLAAGLAVVYRAAVMALVRARPAAMALALLCFAAGAYPWLRYNVRSRGGTVKATARFDASDLNGKLRVLNYSLRGEALYGYMLRDPGTRSWPRTGITPWLLAAAVVAAAVYRDRLALFFIVTTAAAWLSMALVRDAGGTAHHTVLLWPWPHCIIALAAARRRVFLAAAVLGVALGAAVIARHYVLLDRFGSDPPWSEAIYPLADRLRKAQPQGLFVTDWGIVEQMALFTGGTLPLQIAFGSHLPPEYYAAQPGWIFAGHVDTREALPGANARWKQVPGFRRVSIAFARDRQGFPIFELFRFDKE